MADPVSITGDSNIHQTINALASQDNYDTGLTTLITEILVIAQALGEALQSLSLASSNLMVEQAEAMQSITEELKNTKVDVSKWQGVDSSDTAKIQELKAEETLTAQKRADLEAEKAKLQNLMDQMEGTVQKVTQNFQEIYTLLNSLIQSLDTMGTKAMQSR